VVRRLCFVGLPRRLRALESLRGGGKAHLRQIVTRRLEVGHKSASVNSWRKIVAAKVVAILSLHKVSDRTVLILNRDHVGKIVFFC